MTTTIGVYEAKTKLPALLRAVKKGETFIISVRGEEVAELHPIAHKQNIEKTISELEALRKKAGLRMDLEFIQAAKAEGRH